ARSSSTAAAADCGLPWVSTSLDHREAAAALSDAVMARVISSPIAASGLRAATRTRAASGTLIVDHAAPVCRGPSAVKTTPPIGTTATPTSPPTDEARDRNDAADRLDRTRLAAGAGGGSP